MPASGRNAGRVATFLLTPRDEQGLLCATKCSKATYFSARGVIIRSERGIRIHYPQPARAILYEAHIENLGLIRDTCIGIQTLELLVPPEHYNYALSHDAIAAEASNLLDMRFKSIPSLADIIVNFEVYPQRDSSDDLTAL